MNSVLMKEVLNNGVNRHDFCELVGLEVTIFLRCMFLFVQIKRRRGIVIMNFDCYIGDRGSIPTQLTAIHFGRVNL